MGTRTSLVSLTMPPEVVAKVMVRGSLIVLHVIYCLHRCSALGKTYYSLVPITVITSSGEHSLFLAQKDHAELVYVLIFHSPLNSPRICTLRPTEVHPRRLSAAHCRSPGFGYRRKPVYVTSPYLQLEELRGMQGGLFWQTTISTVGSPFASFSRCRGEVEIDVATKFQKYTLQPSPRIPF